jgi:hypothetical protein
MMSGSIETLEAVLGTRETLCDAGFVVYRRGFPASLPP